MRRLMPLLVVLALGVPLSAQVHEATSLNVLLDRFGIPHDMTAMEMGSSVPLFLSSSAGAGTSAIEPTNRGTEEPRNPATLASSKVFNVTAHQFQFDFSPAPFVVNVGDDVTLNISVPSTDQAPHGHSFFLETYMTDALPIAHGRTVTIHFVATTPGTFTYLCLQSDCGTGHTNMNGSLTVNAAPAGPTISSISPTSASVEGGTPITIKGSGFAAGATVRIGPTAPTNVTVVDASTITALTGNVAPTEEIGIGFDVVVTNVDGTAATLPAAFTYTLPPLSVALLQPDGSVTAGGATVAILGHGFTTAVKSDVTFGGVPAIDIRVVSSTMMAVTAPPHEAGTVDVAVTVGSSTATISKGFTYGNPPARRRTARR